MKKFILLITVIVISICLTACSAKESANKTDNTNSIELTDEDTSALDLQAQYESFYEEGKTGRTELAFNTPYTIAEGLNMTITDCLLVESREEYIADSKFYFKATFKNTSDEGIYLRQDGIYIGDDYYMMWGSDIYADIEVENFNKNPLNTEIQTDIQIQVITQQESTPNLSDYVYKLEELETAVLYVNSGNHMYLEPAQQGEYYLSIPNVNINTATNVPCYATLAFDNCSLFCDISAILTTTGETGQ